jgi:putative membrane protein insertion efficiency factor
VRGCLARLRKILVVAVACGVVLFVFDVTRPPAAQWSAAAAVRAIHLYQRAAVPVLRRTGVQCRFTPSCSHYAEAVIRRHGLLGGGWRAAWRVARCGPWTRKGTVDLPD